MIEDLDRLVVPGLSLWQHPRFFGYFPANALHAGILGDLVSTGLGVIGLSWRSSPAVTEVEEVVVDWLRQMLEELPGVERRDPGHRVDQHMVALIFARERATNYSAGAGRLAGRDPHVARLRVGAYA